MVVYIVGAGPGDPELLTIKAKRLIRSAEVLMYDKLVNDSMLDWAAPGCELIYVGKREKESPHSQEIQQNINDLLVQHGRSKKVVRLKGGDPFIFGRGGEEAQVCAKNGIPFEIVPGISSIFAVPAYAGIPVSHRDFNSSFAVLTGHESDKETSSIDWARLPDNIIILMGVKNIRVNMGSLLDAGRDPDTPIAAIHKGTGCEQVTKTSTIGDVHENGLDLEPPVILVVGPIVRMHDELNWFERKLSTVRGKTVVLTSTAEHFKRQAEVLESFGIKAVSMPLIRTVSVDFVLPDMDRFDAIVFTSQEGVRRVKEKVDLPDLKARFFSIGPRTVRELKEAGVISTAGEAYNSEGLAKHILANLKEGSRILALRSSAASDRLGRALAQMFEYEEVHVYGIERLPADPDVVAGADAVFVTSSSCAKSLGELPEEVLKNKTIVSIGPETSANISSPHVTSDINTILGMVEKYMDHLWTGLT